MRDCPSFYYLFNMIKYLNRNRCFFKEREQMAKGKVIIDPERCKGCGLCTDVCPVDILVMETVNLNKSGYLPATVINGEKCIGCANCAVTCPDSAICVYKSED
jgi:2-oxoglutarate ferredoxin oxidoreductase subunit delta